MRAADAEQLLVRLGGLIKSNRGDLEAKLAQLIERNRILEKDNQQLMRRVASGGERDITNEATDVSGIKVLVKRLDDGVDAKVLRDAIDRAKDKLGSAVVVFGSATADGKVRLAAGVTKDLMAKIKAGDLVREIAAMVGGKGGGRPDFAQAGGNDVAALNGALAAVPGWVQSQLG